MSKFTNHSLCEDCWDARNPGRRAVRAIDDNPKRDTCCKCGRATGSGIFVRGSAEEFGECAHNPNKWRAVVGSYSANEMRVRKAALTEAIEAIDRAFDGDLDVSAQEVIRGLIQARETP